jgi:hypothetical protein
MDQDVPEADQRAFFATSSISWSTAFGSRSGIDQLGHAQDLSAEMGTEARRSSQVDRPAEELGKLLPHAHELESWDVLRVEFHQDVHVALGPEVSTEDGAEQRHPIDVVLTSETNELFGAGVDARLDRWFHESIPPGHHLRF